MLDEYDIEIYSTEHGREPFNDWLHSIRDAKTVRTIILRIQRLRLGNFGDYKHFEGLHELRIHYGPGFRIYKDIKACKAYFEDYKRIKNE